MVKAETLTFPARIIALTDDGVIRTCYGVSIFTEAEECARDRVVHLTLTGYARRRIGDKIFFTSVELGNVWCSPSTSSGLRS